MHARRATTVKLFTTVNVRVSSPPVTVKVLTYSYKQANLQDWSNSYGRKNIYSSGLRAAFFGPSLKHPRRSNGLAAPTADGRRPCRSDEAHWVLPFKAFHSLLEQGVESSAAVAAAVRFGAAVVGGSCRRRRSSVWGEGKELEGNELAALTEKFS